MYFAKVLIVSFGMRWIWFSNILDMGKIFVAGSRSSFRTLCPLSCLMGGRWIHLNWVQKFAKGTHYRQRCLCSLLSHSLFFCVTKCRYWVSNVDPRLIRLSVLQMTVLVSCMASGTPKSFSDMSTSIVWLPACDSIRSRLWCCHFSSGQRLPSLYDWNWNNWVSRVVGNSGRDKLLGIYYGPQLSSTDRLQHLLADMQTRCSLWAHRARTLRGQVLIFRQIILPILWFSASVYHVPATGFQDQVNFLVSRFLCKSKSTIALSKDWWFLP